MNALTPIAFPAPQEWELHTGAWESGGRLVAAQPSAHYLLVSPTTPIPGPDMSYTLSLELESDAQFIFGVQDETGNWVKFLELAGSGPITATIWAYDIPGVLAGRFVLAQHGTSFAATNIRFRVFREEYASQWRPLGGHWLDDRVTLSPYGGGRPNLACSPPKRLRKDHFYVFRLMAEISPGGGLFLRACPTRVKPGPEFGPPLGTRVVHGGGPCETVLSLKAPDDMSIELVLGIDREFSRIARPVLDVTEYAPVGASALSVDTELPHWRGWQRRVHRLCKRSRTLNGFVAGLEMRMGCEEVLSLPQYVALCPTGQCNALCPFCSVTINRTGIVKKELPMARIESFLGPLKNTIRLYGLEGNGEPTLHDDFSQLLRLLMQGESKVYLITNGSRLSPDLRALLLHETVDSINISLNAATAETHRAVMKLKNFSEILENIRALVKMRGLGVGNGSTPIVSVSFVVTQQNIHEVEEFLRLADRDLGVDRILIRPLSELGNDIGKVEDVRGLEPYASAVRDMLEAIEDYRVDALNSGAPRRAEIVMDPANFRAVRSDPPATLVRPPQSEGRLLPPRRRHWVRLCEGLSSSWTGARLLLRGIVRPGPLYESARIPLPEDEVLKLEFAAWNDGSPIEVRVYADDGTVLGSTTIGHGAREVFHKYVADLGGVAGAAWIELAAVGSEVSACIDFERQYTPGAGPQKRVRLPHGGRWEIDAATADIRWQENLVAIRYDGPAGPYIMKSFAVACSEGDFVDLPYTAEVTAGVLGIGVLNERNDGFLEKWRLEPGSHCERLCFEAGANQSFRVAIYAIDKSELAADIDWGASIEIAPKWALAPVVAAQGMVSAEPSPVTPSPDVLQPDPSLVWWRRKLRSARWVFADRARIRHVAYSKYVHAGQRLREAFAWLREATRNCLQQAVSRTLGSRRAVAAAATLRRLWYGAPRYYCQKPWTDIANFTVDGRVDVCCIATGASQQRFALGNMFQQTFQEMWNGPTMRLFRRTVNSAEPLPPCQRCPMAYAYQGAFFDPAYSLDWVKNVAIGHRLLGWLRGFRGAGILQYFTFYPLQYAIYLPIAFVLNVIYFRGFRR